MIQTSLTTNKDLIVYILDTINFIIPLITIYYSLLILFYYKIKKEYIYQVLVLIISILYLVILFRFSVYESVNWNIDVLLWSMFKLSIFSLLALRNYMVINEK